MGISFIYFNALISITEFNPHPDLVFDARFSREVAFTEMPWVASKYLTMGIDFPTNGVGFLCRSD